MPRLGSTIQRLVGNVASLTQNIQGLRWSPLGINFMRSFASKKHKNLLKHAKGYRGRSKNCFSVAIRRVEKAWQYAYRDRRRKKREWRKLWIMRLQAAARQYRWRYSALIPALQKSNIHLNRKVLSELAALEPFAFKAIVDVIEQTALKDNHEIEIKEEAA